MSTTAPYLIDLLPDGSKAVVLFHEMGWFQKTPNSHRAVSYNSDDQATVDRHLDIILAFGRGIPPARLGVILDWYGPNFKDPYIDKAGLLLKAGCEKRGMKFSLCFDHGIEVTKGVAYYAVAVAYAAQNYFNSPAFLRHSSGKLFVTDFNTSADWNALSAQYGLHCCRWKNTNPGGYSWIKCGPGDNPTAIDTLCRENHLVEVPGVCAGFDDSDPANPTQSKWGGRRRTAGYENGQAWLRTWKSVPVEAQIIQVITLSDIDERTGIIGNLGEALPADCILPVGGAIPNVLSTPAPIPPVIPPEPIPPAPKIDYKANIIKAGAYLRACTSPDGATRIAPDSDQVNPYFSNIAWLGGLHDPVCIPFVINWMKWYMDHENFPDKWGSMGTVYDASEVGGKAISSNGADSTDAYAGTGLSVAWALWNTGDLAAREFLKSEDTLQKLRAMAQVVVELQQADRLTWALPNYHVKYLMDNTEGYRGLKDLELLLRAVGAHYTADYYAGNAAAMLNGLKSMWLTRFWAPNKDEAGTVAPPNLATWYPDAVAQLFPTMLGAFGPSDPISQIAYASFNKAWPKWSTLEHGTDTFPWTLCGYAAAVMGDTQRASEYIGAVVAKWKGGFTWPFFSAEAGWWMRTLAKLAGI